MKKTLKRVVVEKKIAKPSSELVLNWSKFALEALKWVCALHDVHLP